MLNFSCSQCGQKLIEPLCTSCVLREFKSLIYEQSNDLSHARTIIDRLEEEASWIPNLPASLRCIVCEQKVGAMCSDCLIKELGSVLKEELHSRRAVKVFTELFNVRTFGHGNINQ